VGEFEGSGYIKLKHANCTCKQNKVQINDAALNTEKKRNKKLSNCAEKPLSDCYN